MAYVKTVKGGITSNRYLSRAIEYGKNPDKTNVNNDEHLANALQYAGKQEKALYVSAQNCTTTNTFKEWERLRNTYNKNKGRIAHHFIQSFSPTENVTPEQVHQMGLELAKRCFPDFQVLVCTHIDRKHLHNHILVNSCNINNGLKWSDNKKTMNFVRYTNDKISLEYGCSVIDSYINNGSAQIKEKLKNSYKVDMAKAIRESLVGANTKAEFERLMLSKGYKIRFGKQITFREISNDKHAARGEVLAKQFGEEFSTKSIYNKYGIKIEVNEYRKKAVDKDNAKETEKKLEKVNAYVFETDKRYIQAVTGLNISYGNTDSKYSVIEAEISMLEEKVSKINPTNIKSFIAYLYLRTELFNKRLYSKAIKRFNAISGLNNTGKKFTFSAIPLKKVDGKYTRAYGNITFRSLMLKNGNNASVKVDADLLPKLINAPFFYVASIDVKTGKAKVFVKEQDLDALSNALGFNYNIGKFVKKEYNVNAVKLRQWKDNKVKIKWENNLTANDIDALMKKGVPFAVFDKGDSYSVCFPEKYSDDAFAGLHPNLSVVNGRTNRDKLDKLAVELKTSLSYKIISPEQLVLLQECKSVDVPSIAYNSKDGSGKINLCYLASDEQKLKDIILSESEAVLNNKPYSEWKRHNLSVNWIYSLTLEQVKQIKAAECEVAIFADKKDKSKFSVCTPFYEYKNVMSVLDDTYNANNATMTYQEFKALKDNNNLETVSLDITGEQLNLFRHLKGDFPLSAAFKKNGGGYILTFDKRYLEEISKQLNVTKLPFRVQIEKWKKDNVEYHSKYELTESDIDKLKECTVNYCVAKTKNGDYAIAYPAYNEREISTLLFPDRNPVTCNVSKNELQRFAEATGVKIEYMYISPQQYDALVKDKTEIMSTAFKHKTSEGYNLWYLAGDKGKIDKIINSRTSGKSNKSVIEQMKARGTNIQIMKNATPEQIELLKQSGIECAFGNDMHTIAFDFKNRYEILSIMSRAYYNNLINNGVPIRFKRGIDVDTLDVLLSENIGFSFNFNAKNNEFVVAYNAADEKRLSELTGNNNYSEDNSTGQQL